MEADSRNEGHARTAQTLEGQLRESYAKAVYSHKTHEKCADILLARLSRFKVVQIILSALTTGGFVAAFFGDSRVGAAIGVSISTVLLVLNAYMKNYDLGELAQRHRQAATEIWLVREKYLSLLVDVAAGRIPHGAIAEQRDKLIEDLYEIYAKAPSTNSEAYRQAQEALKNREELTFSDEEIDAFLPRDIRRTTRTKNGTQGERTG